MAEILPPPPRWRRRIEGSASAALSSGILLPVPPGSVRVLMLQDRGPQDFKASVATFTWAELAPYIMPGARATVEAMNTPAWLVVVFDGPDTYSEILTLGTVRPGAPS